MCGGDDTFIAPKTFQVFDNILEQSKVWSKSILFHEGLPSKLDKSETPIDLSSHLSNSYANPYLFPTRFNGTINKVKLINELKLACLQSGFNLVIRTGKKVIGKTSSIYSEYVSLVCQCSRKYRASKKAKDQYCTSTKLSIGKYRCCQFGFKVGMYKDLHINDSTTSGQFRAHNTYPSKTFINGNPNRWVLIPQPGKLVVQ